MIPEPAPNTITRPYRGLSVQDVNVPLTPDAIGTLLAGRDIYRRTAFLVLRNSAQTALVAVRPTSTEPLFSPVAELRVLSGPQTTVWLEDPGTDVGNASALAATALAHQQPGALAYVVQGRFEHVNFIWRPAPLAVRVTEVVPPHPAKLLAMAEQVVAYDEDLPPMTLTADLVDVRELMAASPAPRYLLPCRGSGVVTGQQISFLDTHPAYHPDWLLIGCDRSRQFHEHFYGTDPRQVELCPKARAASGTPGLTLTKCCLLERGVQVAGSTAVVPWGANLDEVRAALRALCGLAPAEPPVSPGPGPARPASGAVLTAPVTGPGGEPAP